MFYYFLKVQMIREFTFIVHMTSIITELRKPKIANIAVFDVSASIVFAVIIARYFNFSYMKTIGGVLVLGEIVHLALGISTPVTRTIDTTTQDILTASSGDI